MTTQPKPNADIRDVFRKQLEKLAEYADAAGKALRLEGDRKWYMPELEGWNGDLFDLVGMAQPFKRTDNHADYMNAISNVEAPGVIGDLAASQLQGDWLAGLERAFRQRHQSSVRGRMHASARLSGHGHELGPLRQGVQKWLEGLVKNSKRVPA